MKIIGCDIGTMHICTAEQIKDNKVELKKTRNMFVPVDSEFISSAEMSNSDLDFVESKSENGLSEVFVIGEDSYRFSNIFNISPRRPMNKGIISPSEISSIDVITLVLEKMIGKSKGGYCVFSVPAEPIDVETPSILYHQRVFQTIFKNLGYESRSINESLAIVLSECMEEKFTGIGISLGAGLTNCAIVYKGTPALTFSVSRGGDFIDLNTARSLGIKTPSRVTSIKENKLNLDNPTSKNKFENRILNGLSYYYHDLIKYVLSCIVGKFEESSDNLQIDEKIPIVISGGTSLPKGFLKVFTNIFSQFKKFPYEISEIRQAKDPLFAVVRGTLIHAHWGKRKEGQ